MKGYIGVTTREWFTFLSQNTNLGEVNFWRKNTNNFRVLKKGEPFFFLVKNEQGEKGERAVLGSAVFERFEVLSVEDAWNKYGIGNGDISKKSFIARMKVMFETDTNNGQIGCIILTDFQVFDNPVYLSEVGIDFKNSVVSGKGITELEVNTIYEYGFNTIESVMHKLNEANNIGFTEDDKGFPEGKQILKKHLIRERNSEVIKLAKERFIQQHGRLFCEVCEFDFYDHYGDIGKDYIEGHHTKPVSELAENEETKVDEIALVCANCHRMLHRKRPWLTINQLKDLLK